MGGGNKKASTSSDKVMEKLEFVLLYRMDLCKSVSDKLKGTIINYTSNFLELSSKCSLLFSLVNHIADNSFTNLKQYVDVQMSKIADWTEKVGFLCEYIKERQKMLCDRASSCRRNSTWNRSSNNDFFELFTYVESFIEYSDQMEKLMDENEKHCNELLPQIMQMISDISVQLSAEDQDDESGDDDDNGYESDDYDDEMEGDGDKDSEGDDEDEIDGDD